MSDDAELQNLQGYVSIKTAAKMLGLAYQTVSQYVREGRIKSILADNSFILIPIGEVENFKRNISGRPRTTVPKWRIAYDANTLVHTSIFVQIRKGKLEAFKARLEEIRLAGKHPFMGTTHRYIKGSKKHANQVEIMLVWRSSVMPDEATREQELEAFRQALDDVLDWSTAQYDEGTIFMHA